jgi:hypothetical protein
MPDLPESGEGFSSPETGFAPKDLTDGRPPGDWKSHYEAAAWRWIALESVYLIVLLVVVAVAIALVWLGRPACWLGLSAPRRVTFARYAYAWLGGTLGGVLFGMKWLYHSVGKRMWHIDRAPWRYLIPHISGGLAFATVAILNSIIAPDQGTAMSGARALAIGFLVGFFSDNAVAKLTEVAETLLGPSRRFPSPKPSHPTDARHEPRSDIETKES